MQAGLRLVQHEQLRGALGVRELAEHAVEGLQVGLDARPGAVGVPETDVLSSPFGEYGGRPQDGTAPHALDLDLRVEGEGSRRRPDRETEVDGVPERVAGESRPQRHAVLANRALHRMRALTGRAAETL